MNQELPPGDYWETIVELNGIGLTGQTTIQPQHGGIDVVTWPLPSSRKFEIVRMVTNHTSTTLDAGGAITVTPQVVIRGRNDIAPVVPGQSFSGPTFGWGVTGFGQRRHQIIPIGLVIPEARAWDVRFTLSSGVDNPLIRVAILCRSVD